MGKIYKAIGLMSGTSMDGIDLALIESDGKSIIKREYFTYQNYKDSFKESLKEIINDPSNDKKVKEVEKELTFLHANLVNEFISTNNIDRNSVDLIGFHGHTILHNPDLRITRQIGDSNLLEKETAIKVISNFRIKDIARGGQGAPLVPIYHFHLLNSDNSQTKAALNIGGISNITYIGSNKEEEIEAFDICFGNAPLDDLIKEKIGKDFDNNGDLAKSGKVNIELAKEILENPIFHQKPPKSFDRNDFSKILEPIHNIALADSLATLCYILARSLQISFDFLSNKPQELLICGGGRKNIALTDAIKKQLPDVAIKVAEDVNLNGDATEAEAFAFLGIRDELDLPISFPKTTGANN